jgi:flagellar protein FliT
MCPPEDGLFFSSESDAAGAPRLIHRYEAIALASRCMLTAARRGDWSEVTRLEDRCRALIEQLRVAAETEQLSDYEQRMRVGLLRDILSDDAEIRARAEPWLQQLEELITPSGPRPRPDG